MANKFTTYSSFKKSQGKSTSKGLTSYEDFKREQQSKDEYENYRSKLKAYEESRNSFQKQQSQPSNELRSATFSGLKNGPQQMLINNTVQRRQKASQKKQAEDYIFMNYSPDRQKSTIENLQKQLDYAKSYNKDKRREFATSDKTVVGAGGTEKPAQASEDYIAELEDRINRYAGIYYNTKNQTALEQIEKLPEQKAQYESASQTDADNEVIKRVLDKVNTGNFEWDEDYDYIAEKFGITTDNKSMEQYRDELMSALAEGKQLVSENAASLGAQGFDYEGLERYKAMLKAQEEYDAQVERAKQNYEERPFLTNLQTVANAPGMAIEAGVKAIKSIGHNDIRDLDSYVPMDKTNMPVTTYVQAVRQATDEDIDSQVLSFLYNTGMSVADSTVLALTLGPAATVAMGGSAAASYMQDAVDRGLSNKQILAGAMATGAAEAVFERFSIDKLLNGAMNANTVKEMLRSVGVQATVEGTEEMFTEVANIISDSLIAGRNSSNAKLVEQYMAQGMTEEEAKRRVVLDNIKNVALAGIGGALSGGVTAGGIGAVNVIGEKAMQRRAAKAEVPAAKVEYSEKTQELLNRSYEAYSSATENPISFESYAAEFEIAYEYGKANANYAALEKSSAVKRLNKNTLDAAYTEGRKARMLEVGRAERRLRETAATVDKSGSIKFEDSVSIETLKNLNEDQKNTLTFLGYFAKFTPSVNVSVFESVPNAEGKFTSENASYSEADGRTLRIDLNAWRMSTVDKETLMMAAASHDLTHFMEQNAPKEYQELSDFVINHLTADGTSLESLIDRRIEASSVELSREAALKEVVATGCEDVLGNSDVMLQMAQQNETLFQKIKKWFENLIAKIRSYYSKIDPKHEEAKAMRDVLDELTQIYNKGLLAASENSNKYAPVGTETQFALREMGLDEFSKETKNNIKLRGGEIVNNKQELLFYVEDAIKNPQKKKNLYLGAISNEAKAKIEQDTQVEIFKNKQYSFVVSYDDIIHITEHFGTDATSVANEVMRLYEIVKDYDSVKAEINEKSLKKLIFDKKYSDYDFRTVEIASNKKSTLDLVTLYVTKNNIKKRGLQSVPPAANTNGSQRGSKSSNQDITYSSDIVNNEEYSERNADFLTTRQVLLDTLEQGDAAQNEDEQRILDNYRKKINELSELEEELAEIKSQIKEKSFTKGADRSDLPELKDEAKRITEKISRADRKLFELEKLSAIKTLVERERTKAEKRIKEKNTARLAETRENNKRRDLRKRIEKHANELSKKLLSPTDKQHIPEELRGAVAKLLENINLSSNYELSYNEKTDSMQHVEKGIDPKALATKRTLAFEELRKQYSKLVGELVIDPELLGDDGLFAEVVSFADTPLADLDIDQLEAIYDVVRVIENSISTANKMLTESRFANVSEIAEKMRRENNLKPAKKEWKLGGLQKLVGIDNLTPEAYFHRLGVAGDEMFRILRNAQDKHISIMAATERFTHESKLDKVNVKGLEEEIITVKLSGEDVQLSKAQLMELYVLMKREQGKKHILTGGILPTALKGRGTTKITRNDPIRVTAEDVSAALAKLSSKDKQIADMLQQYLSKDMSAYGNEASMAVYGYKKFNEETYWPIKVTSQQVKSDVQKDTAITSLAGRGFAKSTLKNVETAITLNSIFTSFANHVAEMGTYAAYLAANEDVNRVRNFKYRDDTGRMFTTAKNVIERVYGKEGTAYLSKLLSDIAIGVKGTHADSPFTGKLVGNLKAASVGANLRVIIQQPTALLRAMEEINPAYLTTGIFTKDGWKKAKQYAPIAKWKDWGYFEINTGRQMKDVLFKSDSTLDKTRQFFMAGAGAADSLSWGTLWGACENETKAKRKDLKPGTQEFYEHVAKRFTEIVDKTQVVDGVLQRSQFMRSPDGLNKLAGSFMAEPTKQYNMFMTAAYDLTHANNPKAKRAAGKYFARTTFTLLTAALANAMAQSVIDALREDDDEKKFAEKWWESLVGLTGEEENASEAINNAINGNFFANVNPVQFVPYIKDVWSIVQGYDVSRMDMDAIADLKTAVDNMTKSLRGEGKQTVKGASINLVAQIAKAFGVPASNLLRESKALVSTIATQGEMYYLQYQIDKFWNSLSASQNNTVFMNTLYNAYLNDKNAYEAISKDMVNSGVDSEKMLDAVVARTKKGYESGEINREKAESILVDVGELSADEAWLKVEEWKYKSQLPEDADKTGYSKYIKIYELVLSDKDIASEAKRLTEHGIKQTEIEDAIKNKLKIWYQGTETERQQISKEKTINYLQKYCNMSSANAKAQAQEWTCKIVQGIDYSAIGEKFVDGEINATKAKELWTNYGNFTSKQASEKVEEYEFKKKYGFFYSEKNEAYKNEKITKATLEKVMREHGEEDADITATVKALDYFKANPKTDYTWSRVSSYYKPKEEIGGSVADKGISLEVYNKYSEAAAECKGVDSDGDGKSDFKELLLEKIDGLNISAAQKDALYLLNWKEKTLSSAPWH